MQVGNHADTLQTGAAPAPLNEMSAGVTPVVVSVRTVTPEPQVVSAVRSTTGTITGSTDIRNGDINSDASGGSDISTSDTITSDTITSGVDIISADINRGSSNGSDGAVTDSGSVPVSSAWAEEIAHLIDGLHFAQKVERALDLINDAYRVYGDKLVVANSLGKDSMVVWHLAKRVSQSIAGFIVTTRYKPAETVNFMNELVSRHPELKVFKNDSPQPDALYAYDPDQCCYNLKVLPTRQAVEEMDVECWVTGLRCTEGRTRTDFEEVEERDKGLVKLNPILIWHEREVWQYIALHKVPVNPLYEEGYRFFGLRSLHTCSRRIR